MFLVAGLGNPGEQYAATPHNLGFLVVDRLAARHNIRMTRKECQAIIGQGNIGGKTVLLAQPQTFMNLSGMVSPAPMRASSAMPESCVELNRRKRAASSRPRRVKSRRSITAPALWSAIRKPASTAAHACSC